MPVRADATIPSQMCENAMYYHRNGDGMRSAGNCQMVTKLCESLLLVKLLPGQAPLAT